MAQDRKPPDHGFYDDLDVESLDLHKADADHLEECRRNLVETGNPLYAWEAWGTVRATWRSRRPTDHLPLPEWLIDYFDACGARLLGWQPERVQLGGSWGRRREESPPKPDEGPGAIGRRLGFKHGLAVERRRWGGQHDQDEHMALELVERMWREGCTLRAVALKFEKGTTMRLGRLGISYSKARRSVERAHRFAYRLMRDRLAEAGVPVPPRAKVWKAYSTLCRQRGKCVTTPEANRHGKVPT